MSMRIAIGCDHNGLELKQQLIAELGQRGHDYYDAGCYDGNSVDYPDIAHDVAESVSNGTFDHGILICGTGIGMSIAANKVLGIRAALCNDTFSAQKSREHNDANILCIAGGVIGGPDAVAILDTYLQSEFEGGRHSRRIDKISRVEIDSNGSD